MDDDEKVFSIDGHVIKCPEQLEKFRQFLRDEGTPLLHLYQQLEDREMRAAFLDLIKALVRSYAEKPQA